MDMNNKDILEKSEKRGVAIVLVVGMLAMLMLAASAFSISMRIERSGATNFKHAVQARQMISTALARALDEIDESLDGSAGFFIYPPSSGLNWHTNIMVSKAGVLPAENARVITGNVQQYIPGILWPEVENAPFPQWRYVADSTGVKRGRYAYMVINCSGLLDASSICTTNHAYGVSAGEIQVPEGPTKPAAIGNRNVHVRYETLPELKALNLPLYNLLGGDVNGFCYVNSLSEDGFGVNADYTEKAKINIGGDVAKLIALQPQIEAGLKEAVVGMSDADATFVYNSLLDYVDDDCIPGARTGGTPLDGPYVEAVPMINEVVASYRWTGGTVFRFFLDIEFCYPFIKRRSDSFTFETTSLLDITVDGAALAQQTISSAGLGIAYPEDGEKFCPTVQLTPSDLTISPVPTATSVVAVVCSTVIKVMQGTTPVDQAPVNFQSLNIPNQNSYTKISMETTDPRFNWRVTDWKLSTGGVGTNSLYVFGGNPGVNSRTEQFLADAGNIDADDSLDMYVADSKSLRSVGELGHILRGSLNDYRWKTIRLYNDDSRAGYTVDTVYDVFCVTNGYRKGLVNVNTPYGEVMDMVFTNAPIGNPADPPARLNDGRVPAISDAIYAATTAKKFNDIADIAEVDWVGALPGISDVERELIISSTAGLLTTRQNLFIIILSSDSYSQYAMQQGAAGRKLASSRAIAEVWRDPYRDENGNHKMLLLSLRTFEID